MRCILMNKNTPVLEGEYMSGVGVFTNIYALYNTDYMPYRLCVSCIELSEWFKNRGIPSFRDRLDLLMHRLNVHAPSELLDKAFGLSLSDQYWLKPIDLNISYDKINFFENDFEYAPFMDASLLSIPLSEVHVIRYRSPHNPLKKSIFFKILIRNTSPQKNTVKLNQPCFFVISYLLI